MGSGNEAQQLAGSIRFDDFPCILTLCHDLEASRGLWSRLNVSVAWIIPVIFRSNLPILRAGAVSLRLNFIGPQSKVGCGVNSFVCVG